MLPGSGRSSGTPKRQGNRREPPAPDRAGSLPEIQAHPIAEPPRRGVRTAAKFPNFHKTLNVEAAPAPMLDPHGQGKVVFQRCLDGALPSLNYDAALSIATDDRLRLAPEQFDCVNEASARRHLLIASDGLPLHSRR